MEAMVYIPLWFRHCTYIIVFVCDLYHFYMGFIRFLCRSYTILIQLLCYCVITFIHIIF